ncbi:MAG: hypothetical protein FWH18_05670 [Marinilabiliaceae bacterium]|nr:hypothetical protein [Marinilabiliaceae bacterium]
MECALGCGTIQNVEKRHSANKSSSLCEKSFFGKDGLLTYRTVWKPAIQARKSCRNGIVFNIAYQMQNKVPRVWANL